MQFSYVKYKATTGTCQDFPVTSCEKKLPVRIFLQAQNRKCRMITIETLKRLQGLVVMAELARRAGIKPATLEAKLRRGSQLKVDEAVAIERALREAGLQVLDANGENS